MSDRKTEFRLPKLRDGVTVEWRGEVATLEYREQGCELDFDPEIQPEVQEVLDLLKDGAEIKTMEQKASRLSDELPVLIEELDRLGLLVETDFEASKGGLEGAEFYRQLRRFARNVVSASAQNTFYDRLASGKVSKSQLVGYALEYYQLVKYAPRLIGPALGHGGSRRTQTVLAEFFASELGHDRMLLESLEAVGIMQEHLKYVMPLPSTFALISTLGVLAAQDPLSFKSVLFIYEEADQRFATAFKKCCEKQGLPVAFYEPILRHGEVNDEYDHGDISKTLLSEIAFVSSEEQMVVKKHLAVIIETLVGMETEILDHYGDSKAVSAVA